MADFIPGEAYRLDIVGADESLLVDSWTSQIKASVVAKDGTLQVDVDTGKVYGPFIGDIQDLDGTIIFDSISKILKADLQGDVYDQNDNIVFDTALGIVTASLDGNILDANGAVMVNSTTRVIDADAIYGTFYGDLVGNITTSTTVYGTFSGDFNGNAYGEFYGDITGTLTGTVNGDAHGNHTGTLTGNVIGQIMADANTALMSPPNAEHNQHNWLGGIAHTAPEADGDIARGPIIVLGTTRSESALRGHVQHYDGRPIITADIIGNSPWVAHHFGKFRGDLYTAEDSPLLTYNSVNGQVNVKSYGILSLEANNGNGDLEFVGASTTFNVKGPQTVRSFNGSWDNKTALLPDDCILQFDAEGFDGQGWRQGGGFGIYIEDAPINNTAYKTYFGIALSDGVNGPAANEGKGLIFDSSGTLRVPVAKLGSTTFAQRDSMTAEAGTIIFNSSNKKFQGFNGTAWVDLG